MERQLKQIRLEPLSTKQSNLEKPDNPISRDTKKLKFRPANHNDRYHKTEPTVDNIIEQMPRKSSKIKSGFTEEYMSLVNKLKVNLSRDYFEKKEQVLVVKKREPFYNDENLGKIGNRVSRNLRERNRKSFEMFSREHQQSLEKRSLTTVQKNSGRQIQSNRDETTPIPTDPTDYKTLNEAQKVPRIHPALTLPDKHRYHHANLSQIEQTNEHVQMVRKGASRISRKISVLKEERQKTNKPNEIFTHMHTDPPEENEFTQINPDYPQLDQLGFHIEILIDIFEAINHQTQKEDRDGHEILLKMLKEYVLGNKKSLPNKILSDDISHIDLIYLKQTKRRCLRNMVLSERTLIIISIDLLSCKKLSKHLPEINLILVSLIGIYLFLFYLYKKLRGTLPPQCERQLPLFQKKMHQHGIHIKKEITAANLFVQKKLFNVLKSNYTLHDQIKTLTAELENKNSTVNRAYYQILKLYATYLNNHEVVIDRNPILRTFATCPSPYLTKPNQQQYTLVLDLDQTLIFAESSKQKLEIFLRPFVKEFMETMSQHYEIIIFTSSMPQYSESIISQLPFVAHKLFRHHCTRLKGRLVKDLLRIGRPLERTIIVDNEQENFMLQKNNGIKLTAWRGDDPTDQELNILGLFLNDLASNNPQDLRPALPNFNGFRSKYY